MVVLLLRIVGSVQVLAAAVLVSVGIALGFHQLLILRTWPVKEALAQEIIRKDFNGFQCTEVRLQYGPLGEQPAWISRCGLSRTRSEAFLRDYALGTRHKIRIDPEDPSSAEGFDYQTEQILGLLLLFGLSVMLLFAARWFWKEAREKQGNVSRQAG